MRVIGPPSRRSRRQPAPMTPTLPGSRELSRRREDRAGRYPSTTDALAGSPQNRTDDASRPRQPRRREVTGVYRLQRGDRLCSLCCKLLQGFVSNYIQCMEHSGVCAADCYATRLPHNCGCSVTYPANSHRLIKNWSVAADNWPDKWEISGQSHGLSGHYGTGRLAGYLLHIKLKPPSQRLCDGDRYSYRESCPCFKRLAQTTHGATLAELARRMHRHKSWRGAGWRWSRHSTANDLLRDWSLRMNFRDTRISTRGS